MKIFTTLLLSLIGFTTLMAQDQIVYNESVPESELHAAINPTDTSNLIVTAISYTSNSSTPVAIYYTLDFGNTWQKSTFGGMPANYNGAADPVLKFDANGVAYLLTLVTGGGSNIHTAISYSSDKGATWQSMVANSHPMLDKPWLAVDTDPSSAYYGNKYTVVLDNQKIVLTVLDANNTITIPSTEVSGGILPCLDVKKNGDLFVLAYAGVLTMAKSTDGGQSFGQPSNITNIQMTVMYDNIIGIPQRLQPGACMAIDNSGGTYDGRIYVTYTDHENGSASGNNTILDTYLTWSDNDGTSWSTPKVINSTAPANTQQYYSNIYVNDQGDLLMAWYDRRDDINHKLTDYYVGISTDGGNTILEIKMTSATTDFSQIGLQNNNFGIGEYCQIVATDNIAIPFWADGRTNDGDINVYFAKISINNPITGFQEISSISDIINVSLPYPNPVVEKTTVEITIKEPTRMCWKLYNTKGQMLQQSKFRTYPTGSEKIEIHFKQLLSGTYFIQFTSDKGFVKTIRVIKHKL